MSRLDLPPVWLILCVILAWLQAKSAPLGPTGGALTGFLGGILVGGGIILMALAVIEFRRSSTTIHPHQAPNALITRGIYRRTRNPIYLADLVILAGLCLFWAAWPSLLLVPVLWWIFDRRFVAPEEARLRTAFGPQFERFAATSPRWLR